MSRGRSFTLDAWVSAQEGDETQTRASIRYEPTSPWSVRFVFPHNGITIVRHISRDMIRQGFIAEVHPQYPPEYLEEAIVVRPDSNDTMVEFVIPVKIGGEEDHLYVRVAKVELSLVLQELPKMVPPGDEAVRFDWAAGMGHCQADAA